MAEPFTLQSIVANLRAAAVRYVDRFRNPATLRQELNTLLNELGIRNPDDVVSTALESATQKWREIGDNLSGLNLDFLDPAALMTDLEKKAKAVTDGVDGIGNAATGAVSGIAGIGSAIAAVLPKRLFDYIVYDFMTATHPKIAGILLLLGILRREATPPAGPAFVQADLRVFDPAQLIHVLTNPRESLLKVLKWGTNDFEAGTVIDGVSLLIGAIPGQGITLGPEEDKFPLNSGAQHEGQFVDITGLTTESARRLITAPGPLGPATMAFVGLHRFGLGLLVNNPVSVGAAAGSLKVPELPAAKIFAVTPDPAPNGNPGFKLLP